VYIPLLQHHRLPSSSAEFLRYSEPASLAGLLVELSAAEVGALHAEAQGVGPLKVQVEDHQQAAAAAAAAKGVKFRACSCQ